MLATIGHFLAAHALAMFMFSIGLRTDRAVLRGLSTHWKLLARALVVVWIAVPLFVLLVLYTLRPPPIVTAIMMVMAICPGVPLVLRKSTNAKGSRETSLLVLITTALTALVFVPLWAAILTRFTPLDLEVTPGDVAKIMLPVVLVPYALGRIVNKLSPRIARRFAPVAQGLFIAGLVVIVLTLVLQRIPDFGEVTLRGLLVAVVITLGSAALGYFATRDAFEHRVSIAYAAAMGNPALALTVIAQSYQANALAVLVALLVIRAVTLIPVTLWFKHHRPEGTARTHAPDLAHAHAS